MAISQNSNLFSRFLQNEKSFTPGTKKLLPLLLLALGALFIYQLETSIYGKYIFPCFGSIHKSNWNNLVCTYFIFCIISCALPNYFFGDRSEYAARYWRVFCGISFFIIVSQSPLISFFSMVVIFFHYYQAKSLWGSIPSIIFCISLLALPPLFFSKDNPHSFNNILFLVRLGLGLRILSWTTALKVGYLKDQKLNHYLDYLFHPLFSLSPNALTEVSIRCFEKTPRFSGLNAWCAIRSFFMVIAGVLIMMAYYYSLQKYIVEILAQPIWNTKSYWDTAFSIQPILFGFCVFSSFIFFHIGTLLFQVGLSRLCGFMLRYPMENPFLSRSPWEYWYRTNNFVREYWQDTLFKPAALMLLRRGHQPFQVYFFLSFFVYLIILFVGYGYRPMYIDRRIESVSYSAALLMVFLSIPVSLHLYLRKQSGESRIPLFFNKYTLFDSSNLKPWRNQDVWAVILTFTLFSLLRGYFEVVKAAVLSAP